MRHFNHTKLAALAMRYGNALHEYVEHQDRVAWLDAIAVSEWIMTLPQEPNYISPFQMQGCLYE